MLNLYVQVYSLVPNRRAGLFVKTAAYFAYRCVFCGQVRLLKKYYFRIYWATRIAHIRLSLVYLGDYIFAHSSVRVNTNSLLECGPRIRYMYTNTWIIQNAQNRMIVQLYLRYLNISWWDFFSNWCFYCGQVLLPNNKDFSNSCFYSEFMLFY